MEGIIRKVDKNKIERLIGLRERVKYENIIL